MKKVLIILSFLLVTGVCSSQSTLDKSLNDVSTDIARKLDQKNIKKIVVLYVTDINKSQTVAGKYIADIISYNLVNDSGNFKVFDRENLSEITEAKKLISEGYIDVIAAKELGRILSVEAIIIGNYTVLSSTLKLTLKALDVNSGFVIAASMKDLTINADAGALLGINVESGGNNNISNRGFNNRPLNSNENYNNPETVNAKCKEKNTGDFCFQNNTKYSLIVLIYSPNIDNTSCTLQPNQQQCLYDLPTGLIKYQINDNQYKRNLINDPVNDKLYNANGQIYVEQCKSKTLTIK